jgi:hypothetical protein
MSMGESAIPNTWQVFSFVVSSATVLLALYALGITRERGISQRSWVILWFVFSLALAVFIVASFALRPDLIVFSLGGAVGYIIAVAVHTLKHAS